MTRIESETYAKPIHGPRCSIGVIPVPGQHIDYERACIGYHCVWCGEPCGSHGCGCEWSERREIRDYS